MEETRLDRIEKNLELFISELRSDRSEFRAFQQESREQLKESREQIHELKESQKKTDEQLRKTDEQFGEFQKESRELTRELKESQKKTDEQLRKTDDQLRKTDDQLRKTDDQLRKTDEQLQKTIKKLDDIGVKLGDMGIVQGQIAEDLFYRNVKNLFFKERKAVLTNIKRNLKKKGIAEYDIVAANSNEVLVIEVKNKLEKRMVDKFVMEKIPKFIKAFPEYSKYRLFAGIGALVVKDEVGRYAEKAGLYVLTQADDGGAALMNRKTFKAKDFS